MLGHSVNFGLVPGASASKAPMPLIGVTQSALATDQTTTSTATPPTATLHTHTFSTAAHSAVLDIEVNVGLWADAANVTQRLGVTLDGVLLPCGRGCTTSDVNDTSQVQLRTIAKNVAPGSHTLLVKWSTSSGTASCLGTSTIHGCLVRVCEYAIAGHVDIWSASANTAGQLLRVWSAFNLDAIIISGTAKTSVLSLPFSTAPGSRVLIDVSFIERRSGVDNASGFVSAFLTLDGVQVLRRIGTAKTNNQTRESHLTHFATPIAGGHTLDLSAQASAEGVDLLGVGKARGQRSSPAGSQGGGFSLRIREFAA